MGDVLLVLVAFACGGFVGFILAAFFAVGRATDEPDEFDGGFKANHAPRVMTRIWHQSVDDRE